MATAHALERHATGLEVQHHRVPGETAAGASESIGRERDLVGGPRHYGGEGSGCESCTWDTIDLSGQHDVISFRVRQGPPLKRGPGTLAVC